MIKRTIAEVLKSGDYVIPTSYKLAYTKYSNELLKHTFNHYNFSKYEVFNNRSENLICKEFKIERFKDKKCYICFLLNLKQEMTVRGIADIMQVEHIYLNKILWQVANSNYTD